MTCLNSNHDEICGNLNIEEFINEKNSTMKKKLDGFKYSFYPEPDKMEELSLILDDSKEFLLDLLENPNLLEHESFTDMLWAVFHVVDELKTREDLGKLSISEIHHISTDMLRAYTAMVKEWIGYIIYLKKEYPFLYINAVLKNPFVKTV